MPHWIYYLLLTMQIAALASLAHGAWRCKKENDELKETKRQVLASVEDDSVTGLEAAKLAGRSFATCYGIARTNTIVLGVLFGLWCLSLLIDITFTITKL